MFSAIMSFRLFVRRGEKSDWIESSEKFINYEIKIMHCDYHDKQQSFAKKKGFPKFVFVYL